MSSPTTARRVLLPLALSVLVAACGDKGESDYTVRTSGDGSPKPLRVTHVLIGLQKKNGGQTGTRTDGEAWSLANDLLKSIQEKRITFEDCVAKFSDDWDPSAGAANSMNMLNRAEKLPPGTYVFAGTEMVPEFNEASKSTPVGQVHPTPVKTRFGYHLIRRDE